eukprot:Skav215623  [mRNA]  locus=scaffold5106:18551:19246:- [translate_table: standard]
MPSPDSSTFTELAGALEKAKEWTKSLQILSMALSRHLVPDGTFAGSIAGAVGAARSKDLAMSLLREMLERWREGKEWKEGKEGKEGEEGEEIGMEPAMKTCNAPLLQRSGVDILKMQPGVLVLMKPSGLSTEMMMELAFGELWSKSVQTVSRQRPLRLSTGFETQKRQPRENKKIKRSSQRQCLLEGRLKAKLGTCRHIFWGLSVNSQRIYTKSVLCHVLSFGLDNHNGPM